MSSRSAGATVQAAAFVAAGIVLPAAAARAAEPPGPRIVSALITPDDIRPHTDVTALVTTSPDVTSVVAQVAGRTMPIPRVDAGLFRGTTRTPHFPRFIHCHLKVTFVARNAAGDRAEVPAVIAVN